MKIAISASKKFNDIDKLEYAHKYYFGLDCKDAVCAKHYCHDPTHNSTLLKDVAQKHSIEYIEAPINASDEDTLQSSQHPIDINNEEVIKNSDKLLVFWDGENEKCAMDTIYFARKYKKDTVIVYV